MSSAAAYTDDHRLFERRKKLDRLRARLIDLSMRNQLLSFRPNGARVVHIIDELPDAVYKCVVQKQQSMVLTPLDESRIEKAMLLLPAPADLDEAVDAPDSAGPALEQFRSLPDPGSRARHHHDDELQTHLPPKQFEPRMSRIRSEYENFIQSTGSNLLYLAVGFLKWHDYEKDPERARYAPLVLVPVELKRELKSRHDSPLRFYQYSVSFRGEVEENVSLAMKLSQHPYNLALPSLEADSLDSIEDYLNQVALGLSQWTPTQGARWEVVRHMCLAFFTFGKDVMYRDLDPELWPELLEKKTILPLLDEHVPSPAHVPSDEEVEECFAKDSIPTVLDADSSQMRALMRALGGGSIAIQGPPGTGKSQTIANLIAAAMDRGLTVLFVAEKLAALNMVMERLKKVGLGKYCLELHSHKANADNVFNQIEDRLKTDDAEESRKRGSKSGNEVSLYREKLNQHCRLMSATLHEIGDIDIASLFWNHERASGRVADILKETGPLPKLRESTPPNCTEYKLLREKLETVQLYWREGVPVSGAAWTGYEVKRLREADVDAIAAIIRTLIGLLEQWAADQETCSVSTLKLVRPNTMRRLRDALESHPAPVNLLQPLATAVANDELTPDDLTRLASRLSEWQQSRNSIPRVITESTLTDVDLQNALVAVDTYLKQTHHCSSLQQSGETVNEAVEALQRITQLNSLGDELVQQLQLDKMPDCIAKMCELADLSGALISSRDELLEHLQARHSYTSAPQYYQEAWNQSEALRARKTSIESELRIEHLQNPAQIDALTQDVDAARRNWTSRIPFTNARKVLKQARNFAVKKVDVRSDAFQSLLRKARELRDAEQQFAESATYQRYFGEVFKGVRTSWELLAGCIAMADRLRSWTGDDVLHDEVLNMLRGFWQQRDRIATLQKKLNDHCKECLAILRFFPQLENLDAAPLQSLDAKLEQLLASEERLKTAISPFSIVGIPEYSELLEHLRSAILLRQCRTELQRLARHPAVHEHVEHADSTDEAAVREMTIWTKALLDEAAGAMELPRWILAADSGLRYSEALSEAMKLVEHSDTFLKHIAKLKSHGQLNGAFNTENELRRPDEILPLFRQAEAALPYLLKWSDYQAVLHWLREHQHGEFCAFAEANRSKLNDLLKFAEAAFYDQWVKQLIREHPDLEEFDRPGHEAHRRRFAEGDRQGLKVCQATIDAHLARRPLAAGRGSSRVGERTDMQLITPMLSHKRKRIAVRELVRRAGNALQDMKPCWMMGPTSVAQFLPKEGLTFDLLVMDEASQIRPEDALGACARAKQLVIVGDTKQMPPSDHFMVNAIRGEEAGDDDDGESVLEIFGNSLPSESLNWHYRSQHESLIAYSNYHFYDNRLIIPPSAFHKHAELGIKWHFCDGAQYHASLNEREAEAVVQLLRNHVLENGSKPVAEQDSIGVVAMNVQQQHLIEEMYEALQQSDVELAAALDSYLPQDPVFIRNLENVQGDERDVIIISFTYGPDKTSNRVTQRFGPINRKLGWRRLNVLFTRTRKRMHVFSSMRSSDVLVPAGTEQSGRFHLKSFLEYAETGRMPDYGQDTGRAADSGFEESVARVIAEFGLEPKYQVGVAGFRIDIGVVDPSSPGTYVCGIECDGAPYHSTPFARDRDRLREEILRARGWDIYRIWSLDWYRNRNSEVSRLQTFLQIKLGA